MSIPLPLMNNLCKRWILPDHIKNNCDLYYLKHISDIEFARTVQLKDTHIVFREHGIDFEVIFQHGAAETYTRCGELEKRKESNDVHYWLSFRSLTFDWNGKDCTKSYVLVQVDKGQKKGSVCAAPPALSGEVLSEKELNAESLVISAEWQRTFGILHTISLDEFARQWRRNRQLEKPRRHGMSYSSGTKEFKTFIEKSAGVEKDE